MVNDISASEQDYMFLLVLLGLSAASETINENILLDRLDDDVGVK